MTNTDLATRVVRRSVLVHLNVHGLKANWHNKFRSSLPINLFQIRRISIGGSNASIHFIDAGIASSIGGSNASIYEMDFAEMPTK